MFGARGSSAFKARGWNFQRTTLEIQYYEGSATQMSCKTHGSELLTLCSTRPSIQLRHPEVVGPLSDTLKQHEPTTNSAPVWMPHLRFAWDPERPSVRHAHQPLCAPPPRSPKTVRPFKEFGWPVVYVKHNNGSFGIP